MFIITPCALVQTLSNMLLENSVEDLQLTSRNTEQSIQKMWYEQREHQRFITVAMGVIQLVDATGRCHPIPIMFAGSFEVRS